MGAVSAATVNTGAKCAGAQGAAHNAWTTPANANCASDNTRATEGTNADRQDWYNFGLNLPAGSLIEGIEVSVEASSGTAATSVSADIDLSWNGGTNFTSVKTATRNATADSTTAHGGAADTWGRAWTAAELSDANFRLRLTKGGTAGTLFRADVLTVRVYYKPPTVLDVSGGGHDGTLVNGPLAAAGQSGEALALDGVNDYVNMGDAFSFGAGDFTFKQNLENLRRNHYAPIRCGSPCVTCETNVMRLQGAKRCAPSKATFPIMRSRP